MELAENDYWQFNIATDWSGEASLGNEQGAQKTYNKDMGNEMYTEGCRNTLWDLEGHAHVQSCASAQERH